MIDPSFFDDDTETSTGGSAPRPSNDARPERTPPRGTETGGGDLAATAPTRTAPSPADGDGGQNPNPNAALSGTDGAVADAGITPPPSVRPSGTWVRRLAVVAVVLFGYTVYRDAGTGDQPAPVASAPTTTVGSASGSPEQIAEMLSAARVHYDATGSFRGISVPEGYLMALGQHSVFVTSARSGTCHAGWILNAGPVEVHADPSGEACTPAAITEAQMSIDSGESG